jgi:hypothetical protein
LEMRNLFFTSSPLIMLSGGQVLAGDALCDKVKEAKNRASCHCATENGATARTVENGGVSNRAAPAFTACKQQRGG